ncbi:hypothetical protein Lal_00013789 [Lupinus albus]|nr:hypothetical protein Lal_00013789 [Lupinus albus]
MAKITGEKTKMGSSRWGFTSVFFSGLLLRSSSIACFCFEPWDLESLDLFPIPPSSFFEPCQIGIEC